MTGRWDRGIEQLAPGYFAAVMATGIVAVALRSNDLHIAFGVLVGIAGLGYVALVALHAARFRRFRDAQTADLRDPGRVFGFFTFSAASTVLGTCLALADLVVLSAILFVIGVAGWIAATLAVVLAYRSTDDRRGWLLAADGSWFVWTVATEGIAIHCTALAPGPGRFHDPLGAAAAGAWTLGIVLYLVLLTAVVARIVRVGVDADQLTAAYWITMGAIAITIVAGARLHTMADPHHTWWLPGPVVGVSVGFWFYATLLIPVLLWAGIWRYGIRLHPVRYERDGSLWAMVFPLGMYAVAGILLGPEADIGVIGWIGVRWTPIAVAAWVATAAGLVIDIAARADPDDRAG